MNWLNWECFLIARLTCGRLSWNNILSGFGFLWFRLSLHICWGWTIENNRLTKSRGNLYGLGLHRTRCFRRLCLWILLIWFWVRKRISWKRYRLECDRLNRYWFESLIVWLSRRLLFDWFFNRFFYRFLNWFFDWFLDWLFNRFLNWFFNRFLDRLLDWFLNWLFNRFLDWFFDWFLDRFLNWLFNRFLNWFLNWLFNRFFDWFLNWLFNRFFNSWSNWFLNWLFNSWSNWFLNCLFDWYSDWILFWWYRVLHIIFFSYIVYATFLNFILDLNVLWFIIISTNFYWCCPFYYIFFICFFFIITAKYGIFYLNILTISSKNCISWFYSWVLVRWPALMRTSNRAIISNGLIFN